MMKRTIPLILLLLMCNTAIGQRVIHRLSRHYVDEQALPPSVAPLLHDDWYQDEPNYNMCPLDREGRRCLVGCVATAMTQVMHYWEWPVHGTGSHEYADVLGCGKTLFADFSTHYYDWENILDKYEKGKYTQQQADAIALLSSDCGIAVNMRYGAGESGARSIYQPMAMANYFDYDRGIQMHFRDFYSLEEITLMLKQELAAGRPVLVSGYNNVGGHAFVIDGYDENDWFHIHLGNPQNDGDGWTYLPYMVPDQPTWYDKDSPENGMNMIQMFTTGVMPSNHPQATGVEQHLFAFQYISAVTDTVTHPHPVYQRNQVDVTVHDLSNVGWNLLGDSVALMLRQGDDRVCPLHVYQREFKLEEVDDTTYTDTLRLAFPPEVGDGTYTITPMYRDNAAGGGKEWREARTSTGTPNYLIAHLEGNKVTLSSDTASYAYLTLESYDFPDHMFHNTNPYYSLTLKNHNAEMAGRLYLVIESLDNPQKRYYMARQGLTLDADETVTLTFRKSKLYMPKLGTFRLHICYESNLFSDVLHEFKLPEDIFITVLTEENVEIAER